MAQEFYIRKGSTLPTLRMEVIKDGRHDFNNFFDALQNSNVKFSMINCENGVYKILNAKAYVVPIELSDCTDEYLIEYRWNSNDTKQKGTYKGEFTIEIEDDSISSYEGIMKVPIQEDLLIHII